MAYPYTNTNPLQFDANYPSDMAAHLVEDFMEGVLHDPQQRRSLTWDKHPFGEIQGEYLNYEVSRAAELSEVTQKYADTTYTEHDEGRREIHMTAFDIAFLIYPRDKQAMLVDPESTVKQKIQWAAERTKDNRFYSACFGNVLTGHNLDGTEQFTEAAGAKIITVDTPDDLIGAFREARTWFDENEYMDMGEMSYAHLPPSIVNNFIITENRVISRDYQSDYPLMTGDPSPVFDFQMLKSNRITKSGGYYLCPFVMESSMIKGHGDLIRMNVGPDPGKKWNLAVYYEIALGWMRRHITSVVQVKIKDNLGLTGLTSSGKATRASSK